MAGEKKGKTYEAFVSIALEILVKQSKLVGGVFWDQKPDAMTIKPDFTVGPDKDHPTHVFLVTHSGSAKDSEKKFWRNVGELVEAKVRLGRPARVYSITFNSVIKEDLKALQHAAFDGQLLVADKPFGADLLQWAEDNSRHLPKKNNEKADAIRDAMAGRSALPSPKAAIERLAKSIEALLKLHRTELDHLWAQERLRPAGHAPVARETFLRRGVGKLLLLDDVAWVDSAGKFKASTPKPLVAALVEMGLAKPMLGGARISDKEMLWALGNLSPADLQTLHASRNQDRLKEWIDSLLCLGGVEDQLTYLATHWSEITKGDGLFRHLTLCHEDPHKLCPTAVPLDSRRVWLYHLVIEWIKLAEGTRTGYGIAALLADLVAIQSDVSHQRVVRAMIGRTPDWRSEETIRLGLQDWQSAHSGQQFDFTIDDLARVADALARRLAKKSKPVPIKDAQDMTDGLIQTVLEAKLLTYRNFKPFELLLEQALTKAGLKGRLEVAMRACFAEAASAAGAELDPRSSGTTVMRVKNTLINWQSVSDAGRDHKKKEICARAPALRYTWDTETSRFVKRPGTEKLLLIVDGTWEQSDLNALAQAGWDGIFYPDEMDKAVAAVV